MLARDEALTALSGPQDAPQRPEFEQWLDELLFDVETLWFAFAAWPLVVRGFCEGEVTRWFVWKTPPGWTN